MIVDSKLLGLFGRGGWLNVGVTERQPSSTIVREDTRSGTVGYIRNCGGFFEDRGSGDNFDSVIAASLNVVLDISLFFIFPETEPSEMKNYASS